MYKNIASKFINDKLKMTHWDDKQYIDSLIALYDFCKKGPRSFAGSMYFHLLKSKYYKEYLEILKEISIKKYNLEIEKSKKEKLKTREEKNKIMKEEDKIKKEWLKAGGRS